MPLTLILGPANSAKAGVVLDAYRGTVRRGALLVVPSSADAAHYDRELTADGTALGRALTFPRLIDEIARRADYQARKLTALQRELVVARACAGQQFKTIAESAGSPGFTAAAGRLLAELRGVAVEAPRFAAAVRQWAANAPGTEPGYADDLATLYLSYTRGVQRTGLVDEQQYAWGALDALRARPDRWGAAPVYFYGFDDLSAVQLDAVRTLSAVVGAQVTVSLTFEQDREALKGRAGVAAELREMASEVKDLEALDDHYEHASRAALHHLERGLFEPDQPRLPTDGAVRLIEAGGALAEAEQVAAEVVSALRNGVPADEIVVIARSLHLSGQLLERTLRRYGVAVQSRRVLLAAHTRLGGAVLTLARLALTEDRDTIPSTELLVYLRAVVVDGHDRLDQFEAEIRRAGITTARTALRHPAARTLRTRPIQPWLQLIGELASASAAGETLVAAVYRMLELETDAGSMQAAAAILKALAEAAELGSGVSAQELLALLESLELPDSADPGAVLVAEPLQVRARRFRRVFVTGLCEGEFPAAMTAAEPFLDADQRFQVASASGLRLPQLEDPLQRERYLLYACVSRATEQVTFSYRTSDEEGTLELPSPFLTDVAVLFDDSLFDQRLQRALSEVTWTPRDAPTRYEQQLALAAVAGDAAGAVGQPEPQTRGLSAEALAHVRHAEVVSAGALVMFARCPVRWLVERQLRPESLEPEADPLARGTFMHHLLERTLRELDSPVTDENLQMAITLLRRFADDDHGLAPGRSDAVRSAVKDGVVATLVRFLRYTATSSARWQPAGFEVSFGIDSAPEGLPALELTDGAETVRVSGTIDRVDVDRGNPRRAVVRDYKSGGSAAASRPGARWISDGEIQVALYMLAAERLLELTPVAGLYQPLSGEELRPRGTFDAGIDGLGATVKNDAVEPEQLAARLAEAEALAVELGSQIKRGQLTPCPATCSKDGCRYPWICWAD